MSISLRTWLALGLLAILLLAVGCGTTQGPSVVQGDAAQGHSLWLQSACVGCHGIDGQGSTAGPALAYTPLTLREVTDITRRGGPGMPEYTAGQVSDQDLQHMYAWFQAPFVEATVEPAPPAPSAEPGQTTPTTEPGQATPPGEAAQNLWTQLGCSGCHGASAEGASATALAGRQIPYEEFRLVVRGGEEGMPPYSASRISDTDLRRLYDWLMALP